MFWGINKFITENTNDGNKKNKVRCILDTIYFRDNFPENVYCLSHVFVFERSWPAMYFSSINPLALPYPLLVILFSFFYVFCYSGKFDIW